MGRKIQVRIDQSLVDVFGRIGKSFADKVKKEFDLDELYVPYTMASQILANHYKGKKFSNFRVEKTDRRKGILILEE